MHVQGHDLSIELKGDNVWLLHSERCGFGFGDIATESQEAFFGPESRDAVLRFSRAN